MGINDSINAHYDNYKQITAIKSFKNKLKNKNLKGINDSLALIGKIGFDRDAYINYNQQKHWAGTVDILTNSGNYNIQFSRREMSSTIIIPFTNTDETVDYINVDCNSDYPVTFLSVVPILYEGFIQAELPLAKAYHTTWGDVLMFLQDIDDISVMMDTTAIIDLKFNNIAGPISGYERDYVLVVNGKYLPQSQQDNIPQLSPLNRMKVNNGQVNEYKLKPNYPNPFNPKTKIEYSIAKSGITKLEIYDILGRLVKVLENTYKEAGDYIVEFDGSNLSSGIYVYRLQSNNFVESKKMVLIK